VVEHPRFFLREDDHPSGSVGEPLEHADFFPTWGAVSVLVGPVAVETATAVH
jgi:hypothetical protein